MRVSITDVTAADIMTAAPATAHVTDRLLDAVARMESLHVRHLPVIDGVGAVVGMLSDRDVRTAVGDPTRILGGNAPMDIETWHVEDAMSRDPIVVEPTCSCAELARMFAETGIGAVPVTNELGRPIGIVSYVDVLRAYVNSEVTA